MPSLPSAPVAETRRRVPYTKGHGAVQQTWVWSALTIVLGLAIYGTDELLHASEGVAGVGGGQGPTLIDSAPTGALQVQVIAQQWEFTYRYPQYGDIETTILAIPVNRAVVFNVTSLDVTHSFWAYQLGVKVDAVPGTPTRRHYREPYGRLRRALRRAVRALARRDVGQGRGH